jgi:hypothetical protein
MEFEGRIIRVLPVRSGTSQRGEWKQLPFVFEYFESPTDRYADSVLLETFDTNVIDNLKEGMEVRCGFAHRTREYEGKTYNELRLYKIESVKGAKQAPQGASAPAAEQSPTPQPNGAQAPQNDPNDDLPF